jgi:hypothetical protein
VDDDLAKALALSKQEFGGGPEPLSAYLLSCFCFMGVHLLTSNVCVRTAKEEREMQLAMEASLKSANQMEVDQTGFGLSADEMYGSTLLQTK